MGGAHHLVEDTPTPKAKKKFYDQGCTEKVVRIGTRFGGGRGILRKIAFLVKILTKFS